ncbi:V-set and immunoglobulin domain-containing protein 8b [Salarias fasciatus]|uniref:Coxsackievirus and adenovirus receptor homolog n=1 Tax=Salarias fasciatus TaxID=181472 RepID=A0A672JBR3_SALFA|nr:coxsackievirus and adenovirus receptor homolog [Salarias fasciatus]
MEPAFTSVAFKVTVLVLITIQLKTEALEVTSSGPQTIQTAHGSSVLLGCTYTPGPQDVGELDIEWFNVMPDMTQKDRLLLSYSGGQVHNHDHSLTNRITFKVDPSQGDASIMISNLRTTDTATYMCKVKKLPGVDTRKVTLVVMVPPSTPKCWVEGGEEKGGSVSLRCKSTKGSIPINYVWKRGDGGALPATATQDPQSGELLIRNHTESNAGTYMCEAKNPVGNGQCEYSLHAYNPPNRAGVIAGAVIGALLLLLLLLLLIWLLICCCHKRRYEKEVANEIRVDAPAPESRPSSRHSSLRSVLGYRTHQGVIYSSVKKQLPSVTESDQNFPAGSNGAAITEGRPTSLKYDHRYGYPV